VRTDIRSHEKDFEIYDLSSDPGERNNLTGSSPAFTQLNQRMKDRVLQLHKASADAARPYDHLMIPAVPAPAKLDRGLHWKTQEGISPWVAQLTFTSDRHVVESNQIPRFRPGHLYQAEGMIKVPDKGKVVLHMKAQGQVVIKVHDNVVLQQDNPRDGSISDSEELNLAGGLHPIRVYAKDMKEDAHFILSWTINGQTSPLPEDALVCPTD
jgi:uncharacterized sulfatase